MTQRAIAGRVPTPTKARGGLKKTKTWIFLNWIQAENYLRTHQVWNAKGFAAGALQARARRRKRPEYTFTWTGGRRTEEPHPCMVRYRLTAKTFFASRESESSPVQLQARLGSARPNVGVCTTTTTKHCWGRALLALARTSEDSWRRVRTTGVTILFGPEPTSTPDWSNILLFGNSTGTWETTIPASNNDNICL